MSDEVGRSLAVFNGFKEFFGAGLGDGSEVFDEVVFGHADACVGDGDGVVFLVGGDADLEGECGVEDVFVGELFEAQFFKGVGCVGDEFPDEDFLVAVEGVDDDVE